eukprot:1080976-Rhodomonas_salina.2
MKLERAAGRKGKWQRGGKEELRGRRPLDAVRRCAGQTRCGEVFAGGGKWPRTRPLTTSSAWYAATHPRPSTLHPQTWTLDPRPSTLDPRP